MQHVAYRAARSIHKNMEGGVEYSMKSTCNLAPEATRARESSLVRATFLDKRSRVVSSRQVAVPTLVAQATYELLFATETCKVFGLAVTNNSTDKKK